MASWSPPTRCCSKSRSARAIPRNCRLVRCTRGCVSSTLHPCAPRSALRCGPNILPGIILPDRWECLPIIRVVFPSMCLVLLHLSVGPRKHPVFPTCSPSTMVATTPGGDGPRGPEPGLRTMGGHAMGAQNCEMNRRSFVAGTLAAAALAGSALGTSAAHAEEVADAFELS